MTFKEQYKTFSDKHPLSKWLLIVFLFIIFLLALIRISLPFAINYGAISWLESQGVTANIDNIDISLVDGSFSIINISGKNNNDKGFSIDRINIAWQWKPLLHNQAVIDQVEIRSLNADALLYENGDKNIAGISIKSSDDKTPDKPAEQTNTSPWDIILNNIIFSNINLCLQQFDTGQKIIIDYCGTLAEFNWSGDIGYKPSTQPEPSAAPLYVHGSLNIKDIRLHNNQLKLDLLNTGTINIDTVAIETSHVINIRNIDISHFSILQRANQTSDNDSHLFAFDQFTIQPLRLSQLNTLNLGVIKLAGSRSYLAIDNKGAMDFKKWLPEKSQTTAVDRKEPTTGESEPFNIIFDEFNLITDRHIIFADNSLKEPFIADIHDIKLSFKQFDTSAPEKPSHILLAVSIGKHGSLKLDANVNHLQGRPNFKGSGEISGFDLRMLAPLTKQHIGHNIRSGQLDVDLKINIDKGVIDSNIGLALHQFVLKTISKEEAEKLNSEFGFPLNSSLSLLRDKDNTIRLDIPVTGDIESPEFNPKDAIVTASSKAITTAVLHYYTPFGLVFAAGSLFDLATALDFEPVVFEPGESKLISSHEEQLDKLAALMLDRPGIHLTLCGMSNNEDKLSLFPELEKTRNQNDQQPKPETLLEKNLIALKELAESRSTNIKNYMVNKKSTEASRLIECSPEYMPDEVSGVAISI